MKYRSGFLSDEYARIPFSVIGVFLILGSSFTTVYVTKLEQEKALEISSTLDFNEVEHLISYVEADISRGLNYAGMQALQYIGKHPVTFSDLGTAVAFDYADSNGDGIADVAGDNGCIDDSDEAVLFNMNWAKNITCMKLNEYLESNFMNDRWRRRDISINIKVSDEDYPIDGWREITFQPVEMELKRAADLNLLITEDRNENNKAMYDTYWTASVDLEITVKDLSTGATWDFLIHPNCIVTSRLPLLMHLTYTYEDTIAGTEDLFSNKLQILTTLISEIYTEARSLVQWGSGSSKIKNIVDNTWLKYVTNAGITAEQFMVFNSVDPLSLLSLILHAKDLAGGTSEPGDVIDDWQQGIFSIDIDDDVLKTLEELGIDRENASDMINNPYNYSDESSMMQVSIGNLSEDLLYEVVYMYYYHDDNDNLHTEISDEFPGYCINVDGIEFTLGYPDNYKKIFDRIPDYSAVKQAVLDEIENTLGQIYTAGFSTDVSRSSISYYEDGWSPGSHHGVPDRQIDSGSWVITEMYCTSGDPLDIGDIVYSWPYVESWAVTWQKTEIWEICDNYNETCSCCNETHTEQHTYVEEHDITFTISASYQGDVSDILHQKIIFGSEPHPEVEVDNNIEVALHVYLDDFVGTNRSPVLFSQSINGHLNERLFQYDDGINYQVDWLKGRNGCIIEALENITDIIKNDEDIYGEVSDEYKDFSTVDDMDKGRLALLTKFREQSSRYQNEEYYGDGDNSYVSAGAKVVCEMRRWFVGLIDEKLSDSPLDDAREEIINELDDENKLDEYEQMQAEYGGVLDDLGDIGGIQFGLAMELEREETDGKEGWTEEIALAVNQKPDYLLFHTESDEEPWHFNIRNTCLFGPTGLPLLPTPVTPWVVTINLWYIEIDGSFESFTLIDTLNEAHANPFYGHSGQIYKRENDEVKDICSGEYIGETQQIGFDFWTLNFAIVPPGRLPIGDQTGGIDEFDDDE